MAAPTQRYLFFDTETTGLPRRYNAPVSDLANWPRIIQLAWQVCDAAGETLLVRSHVIRPDGFTIPADATAVHGITTERARREGRPVREVLEEFLLATPGATLVAHNLEFDEKITGAEFLRAGLPNPLPDMPQICTMRQTTEFCRILGSRGGYKWPRLDQLHQHLFRRPIEGAHDAAHDVAACARCFFELRRLRVL